MISKKAQSLTPYVAGEQPSGGYIKLNTNENPYSPSVSVSKVLESINIDKLKLYPDPNAKKLTKAIADYEGVGEENIFLGNGSDEVLALAFFSLFNDSVAFCDVTYSFYPVYCDLLNLKKVIVELNDDFTIDLSKFCNLDAGGVVIANPNAPTSLSVNRNSLLSFVRKMKNTNIIIDEAYIDFATKSESLAQYAIKESNLLVVKTFSKSYSLAGLRCGYAVGSKELIDALERVKNCFNSYTLDYICQECATASVKDRKYFDSCVQKVLFSREKTINVLRNNGHTVLDSDANFIFVKHKSLSGKSVYQSLKDKKILIRHWNKNRISDYVRVTIGTDDEMDKFLQEYCSL